ncbi:hypothetical protein OQX61_07470 [Pedobacter sp. PLR]|uniref:hypothetical protein n=1 Tax=Pedobacter sp. PLR TaxID=2994465 RepID=UPI0022486E03|nr:hypothetical protein [Pedobacter sp. PLR]MCX2451108.1 hypothetical protein [Pedobacter sp. PLR]
MYSYLFDNNIYRHLSTSKDGEALRRLDQSLGEIKLLKTISEGNNVYKLTPYTLMEAVGLKKVPNFELNIPTNLKKVKAIPQLVEYLMSESYQFYSTHQDLSRENLIKMANIQSQHTDSSENSKRFEQLCIYDVLRYPTFQTYIAECLSFDFICKQDYSKDMILPLTSYLFHTNLYHCKLTSLSKFRLVKLQWQYISPSYKDDTTVDFTSLAKRDASMRLKKHKDYLDCDLIHLACMGDYLNHEFHPVMAFTCDNKDVIKDRLINYKSINSMYVNKVIPDMFSDTNSHIKFIFPKWKPGIVVFCNEDGSIYDYIDVNELRPNYS